MATSTFDEALRRLLVHEGGYTNHPADPGGPTNFGITLADYRKYVKPTATAADVKVMTVDQAKRIYRARYWDVQRCDELPAGVDYTIFDYGVNSGIGRSGKVLRRVLGLSDDTGVVTDAVIAAARRRAPKAVVIAINDERVAFLKRLKTWPVFGAGWGRRVAEVKAFSLALCSAKPDPVSGPSTGMGKGIVPPADSRSMAKAGAVAAVSSGGAAHWFGAHPLATAALVVAAIIVIGLAIFALDRSRRSQQEAPTPGLVPVPPRS